MSRIIESLVPFLLAMALAGGILLGIYFASSALVWIVAKLTGAV